MDGSSIFSVLSGGDCGLEWSSSDRVSSHNRCLGDGSTDDVRRANVDILEDCVFGSCSCDGGERVEGGMSIPGVAVLLDMKDERK
jgi:hypothetical protein